MEELLVRVWENLNARLSGPLQFRLVLQPLMATIFGIRDGLNDAREMRPPFFWGLFGGPVQRKALLEGGWQSVGKIFIVAMSIDAVYQFIAVRWFYPLEALIVATILAILPYLLIRGPVNRLMRALHPPKFGHPQRGSHS